MVLISVYWYLNIAIKTEQLFSTLLFIILMWILSRVPLSQIDLCGISKSHHNITHYLYNKWIRLHRCFRITKFVRNARIAHLFAIRFISCMTSRLKRIPVDVSSAWISHEKWVLRTPGPSAMSSSTASSSTPTRKISFPLEAVFQSAVQDSDNDELWRLLNEFHTDLDVNETNHAGLTPIHYRYLVVVIK